MARAKRLETPAPKPMSVVDRADVMQTASQNFEPLNVGALPSNDEFTDTLTSTRAALLVLSMTKENLVNYVRDLRGNRDLSEWSGFIASIVEAKTRLTVGAEICKAAETRLIVALAENELKEDDKLRAKPLSNGRSNRR